MRIQYNTVRAHVHGLLPPAPVAFYRVSLAMSDRITILSLVLGAGQGRLAKHGNLCKVRSWTRGYPVLREFGKVWNLQLLGVMLCFSGLVIRFFTLCGKNTMTLFHLTDSLHTSYFTFQ